MGAFARQLYDHRMRHGIRQNELAPLIGYHQTYISALEVGLKDAPTPEFVGKLVRLLPLTPADEKELRVAAEAPIENWYSSQTPIPDVYWMLNALRRRL